MATEDRNGGDTYTNTGVAGIIGPNARVDHMQVVQAARDHFPPLETNEILTLRQLAEQLVRSLPGGLEFDEALEGCNRLKDLIKIARTEDADQQQEAVAG